LLESANFNEQMQQELQIQQWVSDKIENVFRQFFGNHHKQCDNFGTEISLSLFLVILFFFGLKCFL